MSVVMQPTGMLIGSGSGMGIRTFDMLSGSDMTGSMQARTLGPARWVLKLVSPQKMSHLESAPWERIVMQLRGRVNHLAAFDPGRPVPNGTRRGALTLTASGAIGDSTIAVSGSGSLLTGDMLQIGSGLGTSQLVKVVEDSSGAAVVIEPPLRMAFTAGAAVAWDHPRAYFKQTGESSIWTYEKSLQSGFALDLLESWE
jgi:hypothetical protein